MSMSVNASSNPLYYLQSLLQSGAAGTAGAVDPLAQLLQTISGTPSGADGSQTSTPTNGASNLPPFGPGMMRALLGVQGQSGGTPSPLFAKLDTDGDGSISKTEFENALSSAGVSTDAADAAFAKLDSNGDGSISQSELAKARHGHGHHHHHAEGGDQAQGNGQPSQNPLDALLAGVGADGATTKTATNADGSTTTTITYADGSTVDMTTPAASANGGSGSTTNSPANPSTSNLLEQLIKLQSQILSFTAPTLSTTA